MGQRLKSAVHALERILALHTAYIVISPYAPGARVFQLSQSNSQGGPGRYPGPPINCSVQLGWSTFLSNSLL